MFEDKGMIKFIYAFLSFVAIFTPGPIFPVGIAILSICLLVYKVKSAKGSPEASLAFGFEIALIIFIIIVEIGIFALRISVEKKYESGFIGSGDSKQELTINDLLDFVVDDFKENYPALFGEKAKVRVIKDRFKTYLKNEYDIDDITEEGNNLICNIDEEEITFTISARDITYAVK